MKPKKIILISIDALRADHLGCYGYKRDTSPHINKFADESILFLWAFSASTCTVPSHANMLTGKYPSNNTFGYANSWPIPYDPDKEVMLQEVLSSIGYETAAFVSGLPMRKEHGLSNGFRIYDDEFTSSESNRPEQLIRDGSETNKKIFAWLEKNMEEDFFLFIHYFDVHGPYVNPEGFKEKFVADELYGQSTHLTVKPDNDPLGGIPAYQVLKPVRDEKGILISYERDARYYIAEYDAGIRYVDFVIGQFLNKLRELTIYDDCLIILTADHGEAMGENNVWFYHRLTVTLDQVSIPFMIKPHRQWGIEPHSEKKSVSTVDIMPTVLSLCNYDFRRLGLDGCSLKAVIEGKDDDTISSRIIIAEDEQQIAFIGPDLVMELRKKESATSTYYKFSPGLIDSLAGKKFLCTRSGGALSTDNLDMLLKKAGDKINDFENVLRGKDSQIKDLETNLIKKSADIQTLQLQLNTIHNSRGWKFLSAYYSLRDKIFPTNSIRGKAIKYISGIVAKRLLTEKSEKKRFLPDSLQSLRVMHVGGYWRGPNDTVRHMMLGLQSAGVHVFEYNTDEHPEALDTEGRPYDRGTLGPVWIREEFIHDSIKQFKPHVIICNAGGLSFYPDFSQTMRRDYYLIGIALSDPDVFEPATRRIAMNFDLYLTNEKNLLEKYRELGANVALLPFGTNEKHFRPLPPLEKYKTDVLVIGRAHPNRVEPVKAIVQRFDTMVYGEGWEKYGVHSRGFVFGDETMHALNSATIVPVFLHNPDGSTMFVKPSILDFPAAGALVITDYLPDVEQYLSYGREIIGFTSTEELIAKIDYYLSNQDEAESIRKAGRSRVLKEHTWAHVWPRIMRLLNANYAGIG